MEPRHLDKTVCVATKQCNDDVDVVSVSATGCRPSNNERRMLIRRHPASASTPAPEYKGNRHEKGQTEPRRARIFRGAGGARELECIGVG